MTKRSTGARFHLGEPWDSNLADFCVAHHGATATQVLRDALDVLIMKELEENIGLARRYEEARRKRFGILESENVHLLKPGKD